MKYLFINHIFCVYINVLRPGHNIVLSLSGFPRRKEIFDINDWRLIVSRIRLVFEVFLGQEPNDRKLPPCIALPFNLRQINLEKIINIISLAQPVQSRKGMDASDVVGRFTLKNKNNIFQIRLQIIPI